MPRRRGGIGHPRTRVRVGPLAAAPQPVVAKIERDAVHPRLELGAARLPARRLAPRAQKHFLRDIFRFVRIRKHAARDAEHARQMLAHERRGRAGVAAARAPDQRLVRIFDARFSRHPRSINSLPSRAANALRRFQPAK